MKVRLNGVGKSFAQGEQRLKILSDLSLDLNSGEVVAIIGASGSGKSTLLSLLAGFDVPDAGEIIWGDRSTQNWSESEWARFRREGLGFVFQHYHLIPYLTAEENVALPLRLLGQPDGERRAREKLDELGLGARARHLPRQLSGGESQRVAIARALIHTPGLILADEPTGSLDVQTGESVLDLFFAQLAGRKQTALIVTHAPDVARRCDRTLRLAEGRLWPT